MELKKRKEAGEKLDWDSITYEELKQLWWVETYPDALIADLYDIEQKHVNKKRQIWDIKTRPMLNLNLQKSFSEKYGSLSLYLENTKQTKSVNDVKEKLANITEEEQNEVINYLITSNPALNQMAEDAKRYRSFPK